MSQTITTLKVKTQKHGRRPIRSAMVGPVLSNPNGRIMRFKNWAAPVIQFLTARFPEELQGLNIGFSTAPLAVPRGSNKKASKYYTIDQTRKEIVLHRMPIQRFRGLHVNDELHRRMFIEHMVYRAICDYLEVEPWELLPGYFEHY